MLSNLAWVHLPMCGKANLLKLGCDEGQSLLQVPNKESRQLVLKRSELPDAFREWFLKTGGVDQSTNRPIW